MIICKLYLNEDEAKQLNFAPGYHTLRLTKEGFIPVEEEIMNKKFDNMFFSVSYDINKVELYWRRPGEKGEKIVEGIIAYLSKPIDFDNDEIRILHSILQADGIDPNTRVLERLLLEKRIKQIK